MGKFSYIDKQGVSLFQRHLTAIQDAKRMEKARTPTPAPAPASTQPVVKTAVRTDLEKRNVLLAQIDTHASSLVRSGHAATMDAARSLLFKQDRSLYAAYQKASYSHAALSVLPAPTVAPLEPGPVYRQVQALARELMLDDAWGKYAGLDETAMMQEVFRLYPSLWAAYREEVSGPGPSEDAPPKKPRGAARA